MCTLSWIAGPDGYRLLFSRDELLSRRPALPPHVDIGDGVRFLAPRDGDAGGTWVFVNEHGVAACLLNLFRDHPFPPGQGPISRGLLVLGLAGARSVDAARRIVETTDLSRYQPFTLALFGVAEHPVALRSEGGRPALFGLGDDRLPLTSSGRDTEGVARSRRGTLARCAAEYGGVTPAALEAFHRSHHPDRGPYSPCMHRPEAATVSLTVIAAGPDSVSLSYQPGAPCEGRAAVATAIPR